MDCILYKKEVERVINKHPKLFGDPHDLLHKIFFGFNIFQNLIIAGDHYIINIDGSLLQQEKINEFLIFYHETGMKEKVFLVDQNNVIKIQY